MKVRVALKVDNREIDAYEFEISGTFDDSSGELSQGVRAAYDKFRKTYPRIAMFDDGTNIIIGKRKDA